MAKKEKKSSAGKNIKYLGGLLLKKMARGGARQLRSNADEVNKLNVFPVPDGDTGDNMRMTIESGISAIENLDSDNLADVMKTLSHGMLLGARGNSGVILSQFFAGTAKGLETAKKADPATFGHALQMGVQQAYSSVMTPTEGTILTVAREAVEYAVERITPESTIRSLFADLVGEMHASVERTPEILAVLKEAGVVDSGGAGLFYIMDGFNRALNGEEIAVNEDDEATTQPQPGAALATSFNEDSDMTYGYCTEFLLQLRRQKTDIDSFSIDRLKGFLGEIGDSIVAFQNGTIVKVHVHTFNPDRVLGYCLRFGDFLTMKIENMSVQHTELETPVAEEQGRASKKDSAFSFSGGFSAPTASEAEEAPAERKPFGIVAVSNGEGISALFKDLGVDEIVHGGQTQNPSTNDFLDAFAKVNAEHIFVFPNNGNILMAAKQAAELYEAATIHVIPSKSIGAGYVALSSFPYDAQDADDIAVGLKVAMRRATAGYVSPAVRNADINGVQITEGDTIGVIEKEIVLSVKDRLEAAKSLSAKLLEMPEKFMLTVFRGVDGTDAECHALENFCKENYPASEVYFIDGGQEVYPFVFVAE